MRQIVTRRYLDYEKIEKLFKVKWGDEGWKVNVSRIHTSYTHWNDASIPKMTHAWLITNVFCGDVQYDDDDEKWIFDIPEKLTEVRKSLV